MGDDCKVGYEQQCLLLKTAYPNRSSSFLSFQYNRVEFNRTLTIIMSATDWLHIELSAVS